MLGRGRVKAWLLAALPAVVFPLLAGAQQLESIDLRQRPAADVIPLIKPFLQPGDGISGSGFTMFVRTAPATLAQIRRMLVTLDQAPESVMISVRRGHQRSGYDRHLGARGAVVIRNGDVDGAVALSGADRSAQRSGGEVQRVRAIAGEPAFIQTGLEVNQPQYQSYSGPGGTTVRRTVSRQDYSSGVYATVQMQAGDRVRIALDSRDSHPRFEGYGRGYGRTIARVQNVSTVVTGRLGEWIPIGGMSRSYSGSSRGLAAAGSSGGSSNDPVYLKVERVR